MRERADLIKPGGGKQPSLQRQTCILELAASCQIKTHPIQPFCSGRTDYPRCKEVRVFPQHSVLQTALSRSFGLSADHVIIREKPLHRIAGHRDEKWLSECCQPRPKRMMAVQKLGLSNSIPPEPQRSCEKILSSHSAASDLILHAAQPVIARLQVAIRE